MCNCEENKCYHISMGCVEPVVANANHYYTKSEVDDKLEDIVISGGGITSGEVQNMIDASIPTDVSAFNNDVPYLTEHQSLSGYATEQWVLDKHYISGVDLSDYALKSEVPTVPTNVSAFNNDVPYLTEHQSLSGYATTDYVTAYTYDKQTIDQKVAQGGTFDPTQYYTTGQTDNLLSNKLDVSAYTPTDLSDYYTKEETNAQISSSTADMATKTWVGEQNYITGVDLSNYATLSDIPTVPTNVSAFNNDVPYLIEHQSLSAYSTTDEVTNMINQSVSGKQDTLIAGQNITISGNVISAAGSSGTPITIDDAIDSASTNPVENRVIYNALQDKADKSEIPTVPTSNTAFTNDAGYLTEHQSLSAYSTTQDVTYMINQSVSGKQDTLTAGSGITISGNVISATGGTSMTIDSNLNSGSTNAVANSAITNAINAKQEKLTAGNNIQISGNTISTVVKFWCGTQAQYNAISAHTDSNTIYMIHE